MICTESKAVNAWDDHHTFMRTSKTFMQGSIAGPVEFSVFKCNCGKTTSYESKCVKGRDKL